MGYNPNDPFGLGKPPKSYRPGVDDGTPFTGTPEQLAAADLSMNQGSYGQDLRASTGFLTNPNSGAQQFRTPIDPLVDKATSLRNAMSVLNGGTGGGGVGVSGGTGGYPGGAGSAGGTGGGSLPYMMSGGAPQSPDMTASNAATFGRAKDQAGQTGRASLTSLRDELGVSGMLGSGAEVQGVRDITQNAAGQLGEVTRDQAVNDSSQKADFAKMKYQGDISMRGQDVQAQGDMARINLQKQLAQQQLLQSALAGLAQAY